MVTANEVYAMDHESKTNELGDLKGFYYDHLPEIEESLWGVKDNCKVEIKTIKDFDFDGRRCWTLRTIWFESSPVMIIQNAGREGDDHRERFITNHELYKNMIKYIKSLINQEDFSSDCVINDSEDRDDLISFYGKNLNDQFERY